MLVKRSNTLKYYKVTQKKSTTHKHINTYTIQLQFTHKKNHKRISNLFKYVKEQSESGLCGPAFWTLLPQFPGITPCSLPRRFSGSWGELVSGRTGSVCCCSARRSDLVQWWPRCSEDSRRDRRTQWTFLCQSHQRSRTSHQHRWAPRYRWCWAQQRGWICSHVFGSLKRETEVEFGGFISFQNWYRKIERINTSSRKQFNPWSIWEYTYWRSQSKPESTGSSTQHLWSIEITVFH